MNRRAFMGACGALLALPFAVVASGSVPRFVADGCRLHFTPFSELDWVEMPTEITGLRETPDGLEIECVNGRYMLSGFPDTRLMSIRQVAWATWRM